MMQEPNPHAEYEKRGSQRQSDAEALGRLEYIISNWRVVIFLVAAGVGWAVLENVVSPYLLLAPVSVFIALVVRHDRVIKRKRTAQRQHAFYDAGIRRLEDRWQGHGRSGLQFLSPDHLYASDLDIFGTGSLFERLCIARTAQGEARLASWLLEGATPEIIRARQEAVAELEPNLTLREDLAAIGEDVRDSFRAEALVAWGQESVPLPPLGARYMAGVLGVASLAALVAGFMGYGYDKFLALFLGAQLFISPWRRNVRKIVRDVDRMGREIETFGLLLARLEKETFTSPRLRELRAQLDTEGYPPSIQIARLQGHLDRLDLRRNQLLAPFDLILLWTFQVACMIEGWRSRIGVRLKDWLDVVGEIEALCALSGYSYENPDSTFPEIVTNTVCYEGEGLAHPLLPATSAVSNDIRLDADLRLYIVSGSNMSGKSTFLRTIGVNAVLALAGAPVRAKRLRMSMLNLGASISTHDSLQAGVSRFYAEIIRLRKIVELADAPTPLLFLLDEIMHGTNSHDRLIGASAIVRTLIAKSAIGLTTTHDLALTRMAETLTPHAVNIHFEDQLLDGKMHFDYRTHSGVVTKSNALELMRAVGLDV